MYKKNPLVNINCEFSTSNRTFKMDDLITGTISITPNHDIEFKSISYSICRIIKPHSGTVVTKTIDSRAIHVNANSWKKDEEYRYSFLISINDFPSYKGKLFDTEWCLRVHITYTDSIRKLAHQVSIPSSNIKRTVFPSLNESKQFPFIINLGKQVYQTGSIEQNRSNPSHLNSYMIITIICVLGVVFNVSSIVGLSFPVFEIIGCINIIAGIQGIILGFGKFNAFTFEVLPSQTGQPHFPVKLISNKQWTSINSFSLRYGVSEKSIVDGKWIIKNIMTSGKKIQKDVISEETTLMIPFPKNTMIPISFSDNGCQIIWQLVATIQLKNGRSKDYYLNFPVMLKS